MDNFEIISSPRKLYHKMLNDISRAKSHVFLETYIYGKDEIGNKFRNLLIKKAKQGIKIKVLLDAWGAQVSKDYFKELIDAGGEVRFFREFQYVIRIVSKNHERNHRKLLIIDDKISYIGSANIIKSCLDWRELTLRIYGEISKHLKKAFMTSWENFGKLDKKWIKKIFHKSYSIIQETSSKKSNPTENSYLKLIKRAREEILIETPYFVPSFRIRRSIYRALERGVRVKILLPYRSDVRIMDIIRNRYLGKLYRKGAEIYYYKPRVLHSKLMIIDNSFFILGSSNLDRRSLFYQEEINLAGKDINLSGKLREFFMRGINDSVKFNYEIWKSRSSADKMIEMFLSLVREYL